MKVYDLDKKEDILALTQRDITICSEFLNALEHISLGINLFNQGNTDPDARKIALFFKDKPNNTKKDRVLPYFQRICN